MLKTLEDVKNTFIKAGCALSEDQEMILAGVMSFHLNKLHTEIEQYKKDGDFNPPITCSDCCSLLKQAKKEIEELEQKHCSDCLEYDDDGTPYTGYGWNENREEGQIPCGCIQESGPYQVLEQKHKTLVDAVDKWVYSIEQDSKLAVIFGEVLNDEEFVALLGDKAGSLGFIYKASKSIKSK